jgi:hypothetical protein
MNIRLQVRIDVSNEYTFLNEYVNLICRAYIKSTAFDTFRCGCDEPDQSNNEASFFASGKAAFDASCKSRHRADGTPNAGVAYRFLTCLTSRAEGASLG